VAGGSRNERFVNGPETGPKNVPRVAIYMRVSTLDQDHEPQRKELLEFCVRKGWPAPVEFADRISGAKFTRTGLDKLMRFARKRLIEIVVCVKLDRLGRSLPHLAQLISELDKNKVALICSSQGIDTSHDNPAGRLQMHVLMAVAEFERSLIRERTKAGLAVARARGAKIGRPKLDDEYKRRVLECLARNPRPSLREVVAECRVSLGTVAKLAKGTKE
jgi:putative DNA-invertase from lambdoid prophage Rac